jgi:hypothetical protein
MVVLVRPRSQLDLAFTALVEEQHGALRFGIQVRVRRTRS